jgi:hypothetical protein
MDCEICNVEPAAHYNVPTTLGRVLALCDDCRAIHGRRAQSARKTFAAPRPASSGQMFLPFNETGGHVTAACST